MTNKRFNVFIWVHPSLSLLNFPPPNNIWLFTQKKRAPVQAALENSGTLRLCDGLSVKKTWNDPKPRGFFLSSFFPLRWICQIFFIAQFYAYFIRSQCTFCQYNACISHLKSCVSAALSGSLNSSSHALDSIFPIILHFLSAHCLALIKGSDHFTGETSHASKRLFNSACFIILVGSLFPHFKLQSFFIFAIPNIICNTRQKKRRDLVGSVMVVFILPLILLIWEGRVLTSSLFIIIFLVALVLLRVSLLSLSNASNYNASD